jgi:hypothetical protein
VILTRKATELYEEMLRSLLESYLEPRHVRGGPRSRPYTSAMLQALLENKMVAVAEMPCAHAPWVLCHYYYLTTGGASWLGRWGSSRECAGRKGSSTGTQESGGSTTGWERLEPQGEVR